MASRIISAVLQFRDQNFSTGLKQASKDAKDFQRATQTVENEVNNFATSANNAFNTVAGVISGTLVTAFGGLAIASANTFLEMEQSFNRLQAQTGATGSDLQDLSDTAINVFNRGLGDSLLEVSDALALVRQNIHDISAEEIEDVTAKSLILAKTLETDVSEVTRGTQNLIETFGVSSSEALDLLTAGAQQGANASQDLFDQVAEFSAVAERAGYTADEFLGTLVKGAQNGVYNMDRVNVAILEFDNIVSEGGKVANDAFSQLSQDTRNVFEEFKRGEATSKELSNVVITELKSMDNQTKANQIGAALWGTVWEDNTQAVMYEIFDATSSLEGFSDASDKAVEAVENGFGNRVKSAFREATTAIAELGNTPQAQDLLDSIATTVEELVPVVLEVAQKALDFATVIRNNWTPIRETVIALGTAAVILKGGFLGLSIITTVTTWLTTMTTAIRTAGGAMAALNLVLAANPIGAVIAAVSLLTAGIATLYRNSETFRNLWGTVWTFIKNSAQIAINGVIEEINRLISTINKIPGVNIPLIAEVQFVQSTPTAAEASGAGFRAIEGSYAVGSNRITKDQVAEIHEGEMIIPARQAQKVRQAGGTIDNIDSLVTRGDTNNNNVTRSNSNQTINVTVNANQLSYEDVVNRFSKDIKLALANM